MVRHKRGQAALEFLSTYGFAFLIILVMIGALAYFGVLDPSALLPDRCDFPTELRCDESFLTESGTVANGLQVSFVLQNNIGDTVSLQDLRLRTAQGHWDVQTTGDVDLCDYTIGQTVAAGSEVTVTCDIANNANLAAATPFPESGSYQVWVNMSYQAVNSQFPRRAEGSIRADIQ